MVRRLLRKMTATPRTGEISDEQRDVKNYPEEERKEKEWGAGLHIAKKVDKPW